MKKLSLNIMRTLELMEGLKGLDRPDKDEGPAFKFSGGVRMRNARNLRKLGDIVQAYEDAKRVLQLKIPDKPSDSERASAQRTLLEMAGEMVAVELETSTEAELRLEQNPIPVGVLAALMPIIEDEAA